MMDGDVLHIGGRAWRCISGHGHAPEHISLYCDELKLLIGGDMIHACAKMALECGMAVLDGFHHATEQPGLRRLADRIASRFPGLPVRFFEEPAPWYVV